MSVSNVGSSPVAPSVQIVPPKNDKEAAAAVDSASPAKPQNNPAATVQISSAGKKLMQEATETAAQTAKEAIGGDQQAQRIIKKEAAAKDIDHDGDKH